MKPETAVLLAAGVGSRLAPLTEFFPKCLMPIGSRPLMDYWLATLKGAGVRRAIVNVHAHAAMMQSYLDRPQYANWVHPVFERELLGTAGSVRALANSLPDEPVVVAHADNLISCDFSAFVQAHTDRAKGTDITMMTFSSSTPKSCGVVQVNDDGIVTHMDEKPDEPSGCLANGAVYIFEPEVVDLIVDNPDIDDISEGVLPHFFGRIQSWFNPDVLRDIGTIEQLRRAQLDPALSLHGTDDEWQSRYVESSEFNEIQKRLLK